MAKIRSATQVEYVKPTIEPCNSYLKRKTKSLDFDKNGAPEHLFNKELLIDFSDIEIRALADLQIKIKEKILAEDIGALAKSCLSPVTPSPSRE